MTNTAQRAILEQAEESFERVIMPTAVGRLDEDTISVCRKCYAMGFINGGDHVMREGGCYESHN
jgi:hypothetical protein